MKKTALATALAAYFTVATTASAGVTIVYVEADEGQAYTMGPIEKLMEGTAEEALARLMAHDFNGSKQAQFMSMGCNPYLSAICRVDLYDMESRFSIRLPNYRPEEGYVRVEAAGEPTRVISLRDVANAETAMTARPARLLGLGIPYSSPLEGLQRLMVLLTLLQKTADMTLGAIAISAKWAGIEITPEWQVETCADGLEAALGSDKAALVDGGSLSRPQIEALCEFYINADAEQRQDLWNAIGEEIRDAFDLSRDVALTPTGITKSFQLKSMGHSGYFNNLLGGGANESEIFTVKAERYDYRQTHEINMPLPAGQMPAFMRDKFKVTMITDGSVWIAMDRDNPKVPFSLQAIGTQFGFAYALLAQGMAAQAPKSVENWESLGAEFDMGFLTGSFASTMATIGFTGFPIESSEVSQIVMPMGMGRHTSRSNSLVTHVLHANGETLMKD